MNLELRGAADGFVLSRSSPSLVTAGALDYGWWVYPDCSCRLATRTNLMHIQRKNFLHSCWISNACTKETEARLLSGSKDTTILSWRAALCTTSLAQN